MDVMITNDAEANVKELPSVGAAGRGVNQHCNAGKTGYEPK